MIDKHEAAMPEQPMPQRPLHAPKPGLAPAEGPQRLLLTSITPLRQAGPGVTAAAELRFRPHHSLPDSLHPGMQIGLFVPNPEKLAAHVLAMLWSAPEGLVNHSPSASAVTEPTPLPMTAMEILRHHVDLSRPSMLVLLALADAELTPDHPAVAAQQRLRLLALQNRLPEVQESYSLPELLHHFPDVLSFEQLVQAQPPLANRKYTLSDVNHATGELAILVAELNHHTRHAAFFGCEQEKKGQEKTIPGMASHALLSMQPGDAVDGFMDMRKRKFRYPEDATTPVIMLASGVGLAPHLSHLRDAERTEKNLGPRLLYLGSRQPSDSLLADELSQHQQSGRLTDVIHAYSRHPGHPAAYAQDALLADHARVFALLEQGAIVAVCGWKAMLDGTRQTLQKIAALRGIEDPAAYVEKLESEGRLHHSVSLPDRFHTDFAKDHAAEITARMAEPRHWCLNIALHQLAHVHQSDLAAQTPHLSTTALPEEQRPAAAAKLA
jgi:sulfite reductase alpha subunit-like flavoprotein